ncbi:hypothetical protein [Microseira sp. BLCC-F43]|jgi:hypothetical protein|uniref:hypothetical protein n=1 Tax=Microseira sp. BLCC-F43 TaxID=3153602 RepID=UPI0035B7A8A1
MRSSLAGATQFAAAAEQLRDMVADAEAQAAENQQLVLAGATQFAASAVYLISIPFMQSR